MRQSQSELWQLHVSHTLLQRMTKNGLVSFFNEGCLYKKKKERDRGGERERERKIKRAGTGKSNLTSFLGQSFIIIAG